MTTKKNNSGFVQIILILVVVALAIGGAYYFGTLKNKTSLESVVPTLAPTSSATALATADPTANWKTYTNKKMFLSLKYPKDRNLQIISSQYNELNFALNTEQYAPMFFEAAFLPNTQMEKWYDMAYSSAAQTTQTPPSLKQGPTIEGKPSSYSDFVQSGNGAVRHVFVQAGSGLYQFVIPISNNELQYQILSTFKFTK